MNVLKDLWIPVWTQKNQHIRVTLPTFYEHARQLPPLIEVAACKSEKYRC